jgi:hypothetical protein
MLIYVNSISWLTIRIKELIEKAGKLNQFDQHGKTSITGMTAIPMNGVKQSVGNSSLVLYAK